MSTVQMKTLLRALAGLQAASRALQSLPYGTPQREAFHEVRDAEIYLRVELACMAPVEVSGAEVRGADSTMQSLETK